MSEPKKRGRGKGAKNKLKVREPGPLAAPQVQHAIACAREGWTAEEIAAALRVRLIDVQVWLAIFEETRKRALPLGDVKVPTSFSPLETVRQIAASEVVPSSVRLQACKVLLQQSDAKMRVDWAAMRIDDIPQDQRAYLAGMLIEHVKVDGVDEEFIDAGQAERDLFMIVGVLVDDQVVAIELLNRHRQHLEDLRAEAKRRKMKRRLEAPTVRFAAEYKPGKSAIGEIEVEAIEAMAGEERE